MNPTHYDTLGVSHNAPTSIIKAAYRTWMKEVHPDTGTQTDAGRAAAVNEAFRVLSNSAERQQYDALLEAESSSPAGNVPQEDADIEWGVEEEIDTATPATPTSVRSMSDDFSQEDPSRIAGFNVFDRVGIDLADMEWFTRDYGSSNAPVARWRMSRKWSRGLAWALLVLLVLSLVLPAVATALTTSVAEFQVWGLITSLLVVPAISFACGYPRASRHRGTLRYVVFLVLMLLLVGVSLADKRMFGFTILFWLISYIAVVELFRVSGPGTSGRKVPMLPRADVEKYTVWGQAGGDLTPASSGARALALTVSGRIMTGQLLNELTKIPGVRIVHRSRAAPSNEVDHAVLCGDRLAVVQSQHWRSGDYYWFGPTLVHSRTNEAPQGIATSFPAIVEEYSRAFPQLRTRGWFVIHSSDGGSIRTNNRDASGKPCLSTPEPFLREVGEWLAAGERPTAVNRKVLSKLVFGWR